MNKTIVLKAGTVETNGEVISLAAGIIRNGGLVAFPTETVYGLGANALDRKAVQKLYQVKKRPRSKPFTVQIADVSEIKKSWGCEFSSKAALLAEKFWPGPLTIILRASAGGSVGFRIPKHDIAFSLIRAAGVPLFVPSANVSGNRPSLTAGDVLGEFEGKIDAVIDGGPASGGIESTVVDLTSDEAKILREGSVTRQALSEVIRI